MNIEIPTPEPYNEDPAWFDLSGVDRDTVKFHLQDTLNLEATISSAHAEAVYLQLEADRQASEWENRQYILYKQKPHKKTNKDGEEVWADGSDDYAKAASRIHPRGCELRRLELLWRRRRVHLEGTMRKFQNKVSILCTLGGVLRSELNLVSGV